jgi:predicted DNA-binding transcriptional regulator AlpA
MTVILTIDQAAQRASITRRTLERLRAEGEGPAFVQVSKRRVGILESDLETWLLKRRRPAPGEAA